MTAYKGFTVEGFDRAEEEHVRKEIDRIDRALRRQGVAIRPLPIMAEKEPGVTHAKYGDFCDYAQVAYYNPNTRSIVLSGDTPGDRKESIRHLPHEYAHFIDVEYLKDVAKDEWWADRFMEWVDGDADGGERFKEHLTRAVTAMKADGGVVQPKIERKIASAGKGPGKGWWRQRERHGVAAVKGWFRRRRR